MSCYNWEEGTIKIPTKEWAKLRTDVVKAWNASQLEKLERATKMHERLKGLLKGKRGSKRVEALRKFSFRVDLDHDAFHMVVKHERDPKTGCYEMVLGSVPKKKDLGLKPTSKSCSLDLEDATIIFRNEDRTVTWSVGENNRAVERSRKHPVAQVLFRRLNRIEWTRGTGGEIVGNDEYNRDADYAGGGGNYVTATYRPLSKKEKEAKAKAQRRAAASPYFGGGYYGRRW
jgi:hypothetical protein